MMNKITLTRRIGTGVLVAALMAGCASGPTQESTGEYIDDSAITARVKTEIYNEIYNDPMLKVGQISVESYKGVVQLSGFVDSKQSVAKATQLASSVKGVQAVKNSLIVK